MTGHRRRIGEVYQIGSDNSEKKRKKIVSSPSYLVQGFSLKFNYLVAY